MKAEKVIFIVTVFMFNILFKDEVVLIHTWVVTERWGEGGEGGEEMAVVYHPGKGVYILI